MTVFPEKAIIKGCKNQKPKFQEALVNQYSPMLMTVCRRYTTDDHRAKDILQDALIKILNALPQYQPTGSFEAWMRRIVITTALKSINKKWLKKEAPYNEQSRSIMIPADAYARLGAEDLLKVIRELPEGYQQIFNLSVIEGYNHKEIGELLGIKESTSRSQLTRARKMLQEKVLKMEKVS